MSSARSTSSSDRPTDASSDWIGVLLRWIPVVVWATFISWFSTDAFSARSTNSYIDPVLRWFFGDLTPTGFRLAHNVVRKSAHLLEYAILAMLACRAQTAPRASIPRAVALRTLAACAAYAALDEAHQAFVPSRTGSWVDVAVDVTGATLGAWAVTVWRGRGRPARGA